MLTGSRRALASRSRSRSPAGCIDRIKPTSCGSFTASQSGRAECLAWWDFSAEIQTDRIIDRGPHGLHGHVPNLPTRAMNGSRWTGEETSWRHMPRHYAAIHFHEDDLYDCRWETDFIFDIPAGMASGVYGILHCGDIEVSYRSMCCRRRVPRRRQSFFWPGPSPIRSMATISAKVSTTPFARGRRCGVLDRLDYLLRQPVRQ